VDQGGEDGFHHRLVVQQSRDDFRAVAFLDKGLFHQGGGAHVDTVTPGSDGSPAAPQDHPRGQTDPGSDAVARMSGTADASEPLNREHKDARHKVEPEKGSTEVKIFSGGQAANIRATFES